MKCHKERGREDVTLQRCLFYTRGNEDMTEEMRLPHSRLHRLCDMYSDVTDMDFYQGTYPEHKVAKDYKRRNVPIFV